MASPTSRLRRGPSSLQLVTAMRPSARVTRASSRRPAADVREEDRRRTIDAATEKRRRSRSRRLPVHHRGADGAGDAGRDLRCGGRRACPAAKSVASTVGAALGGADRERARARGDVEDLVAGVDAEELHRVGGERAGERREHLRVLLGARVPTGRGLLERRVGHCGLRTQNSLPSGSASTTHETSGPWPTSAGVAPSAVRRADLDRLVAVRRRMHVEVGAALHGLRLRDTDDVEVGRPVAGPVQRDAVVAAVAHRPSPVAAVQNSARRPGSFASRTIDGQPRRALVPVARVEHAELVALGVGEHHPGGVVLADVGVGRARGAQPRHRRGLRVGRRRREVEVDAVLDRRLGVGHPLEEQLRAPSGRR